MSKTEVSHKATQFTRYCIDDDGDLLLRVGSELAKETPFEFKVCSAAMRRASPVWKSMLFGPWNEAKPAQGDWIVYLPEDEPWPIRVILAIAHGAFEQVPKSISLSKLDCILIPIEKYDLIHIIRPWADTWVETVKNPKSNRISELTGSEHVMRINAAWELGCEDVVSAEITEFVFNLSVTSRKETYRYYYNHQQIEFDTHFGPCDLVEIVTELRLSLIQALLDFYHEVVKSRIPSESACLRSGWNLANERQLCDAVVLGGIWRYSKGSMPEILPEKATEYRESANELMRTLSNMFAGLPTLNVFHEGCSPAKKYSDFEEKTRQDERWKNVLRPHHKERMATQRKKTGL
ncbi:hypothetical protein C8A03DRAFT_41973 [Achaetomium macrosporum]|uniref:BTB domain-containing protein n=1 Tax=Achaetomium macrosporum TaxID=79813 RepID=A0AAN7HD68_9PEZI|nr:hypothetical protein C8A03DRAFT_41973 [Achaetomium macrosporum]